MSKKASTLKNSVVIGITIFFSRVLGFIRDKVIAYFIPRELRDLFFVGLMIPNTLARLLGEGAFSSGFLPIFSRLENENNSERLNKLTTIVLNYIAVISGLLAVAVWILVPYIYRVFFYLEPRDITLFPLGVAITRWMIPYIMLISICSVGMSFLNSKKHFFIPAFASSILNLCLIVFPLIAAVLFKKDAKGILFALSYGVFFGGIIQVIVFIITMYKRGFKYYGLLFEKLTELMDGLKRMVPSMVGMSVMQINIIVDKVIAWILPTGGISALYYAGHLFNLPLALIGYSVSLAVFPETSIKKGDELSKKVIEAQELVSIGTVPATVGLVAAGHWIIKGLFYGGNFTGWDLNATYLVLLFYSTGIYIHSNYKLLITTFYSIDDTMTPLKISVFGIILNFILNLIFMQFFSFAGLALATSVTGLVNFYTGERILRKRGIKIKTRGTDIFFIKNLSTSLLMGIIVFLSGLGLDKLINGLTLIKLAVILIIGVASHYIIIKIFRFNEGLVLYSKFINKIKGTK